MLKIDQLTKYYGKTKGVENLSLEISEGEIFGFIGPNGAGKSTTIRCIMNLVNKTAGSITIKGVENSKDNFIMKEEIGYLPSEIFLYDDLTVKEMLDYSSSFYKENCSKKRKHLVTQLKLDEKKKIEDLSLGNLKKLGIVLALMHSPKLLILDEPTSGLDPIMQETFYKLLLTEKENGTTIFYSTHILTEINKICDRVGIIKDGHLVKIETIDDLKNNQIEIVTLKSNTVEKIKKDLKIKPISETNDTIKFMYSNKANDLIKVLSKYDVEKLLIEDPSIEDIFIHYYE